jgi:chromosomal replication initiation ATPase DnaA
MHTVEELHQHYLDVRKRLMQGRRKEVKPQPEEKPQSTIPENMTSTQRIIWDVAQKHGVTIKDMVGPIRTMKLVAARHEAFYRIRTEQHKTLQYIGRFFGRRDHTTVLHGIRRHKKVLDAMGDAEAVSFRVPEQLVSSDISEMA